MYSIGHNLGKTFEDEFTAKAKACGMSDKEAKSAFNANMLDSGVLTEGPANFGRRYSRRWLVTDYEAGDVVLHNTHMVGSNMYSRKTTSALLLTVWTVW